MGNKIVIKFFSPLDASRAPALDFPNPCRLQFSIDFLATWYTFVFRLALKAMEIKIQKSCEKIKAVFLLVDSIF